MRMISSFVKTTPLRFERFSLTFPFCQRKPPTSLNAWGLSAPTVDTATVCVCVVAARKCFRVTHDWFHVNFRLLSGVLNNSVKLFKIRREEYRKCAYSDSQLVFGIYPSPIATLPSSVNIWT